MKTSGFFKESLIITALILLITTVSAGLFYQKSFQVNNVFSGFKNGQLPEYKANYKDKDDDKTLSPYFFVKCEGSETEQLPLKATTTNVSIAGVIADVTVRQVYVNTGKKPIEAIYIFPASTRAAVYSMRMKVGGRLIIAKIEEKQQARQNYEAAKSQGKSASLLEQERPNVFQMNVANIMPGDTISLEMCYTELLIPEEGVYEFVYPTVVGPRYSNKNEETASADDKWVSNPYTHAGEKPSYIFDFNLSLNAGMAIKDVRCTSHQMNINYDNPANANLKLSASEAGGGNKDVIIQYRLADNKIESGVLLYKGENGEENFFLAMIQPPARPSVEMIPPREYVFIMDVSGSMMGYPVETSKKLLKNLIGNLRSTDKFNVVLFAGGSSVFAPQSIYATSENLNKAIYMIENQQGGGGTELLPALKKAMEIEKQKGFSRTFVIATDGYVDVEKESFTLIRENLSKANFFAFGIGSSVNRFLIEGIANAGMGESFIVTDEAEASAKAEKFRKYIQTPVLTDVKVKYDGFDAYDIEPFSIPDLLAERPLIIFGKWKGNATGKIKISGTTGKDDFVYTADISLVKPTNSNKALKYLWARQRIRILDDMNNAAADDKIKEEVTALGLKYNLLTNYTSFIAIDSVVRNVGGKQTTVKQPLPLPDKVSDYAVGGAGAGATGMNGAVMKCAQITVATDAMEVEKQEEKVFNVTEETPEFIGGEKAMKNFIKLNIVYPEAARLAGISGKVYVQFTVEANGDITNVKVLRGIGGGCDEEAARVIALMKNKWKPGKSNGIAVSVQMTIPIKF
jgi:Ca-activated chloride channel family protein